MGTRCVVKVEGVDFAQVYIHWDGYPEHMMPWLGAFNYRFTADRGDDPNYKFAQLLRSSERDADEFALDNSYYTGYGVVPFGTDCGQEYEYTLLANGLVEVESKYDEH